jgi:hypothetical protein
MVIRAKEKERRGNERKRKVAGQRKKGEKGDRGGERKSQTDQARSCSSTERIMGICSSTAPLSSASSMGYSHNATMHRLR